MLSVPASNSMAATRPQTAPHLNMHASTTRCDRPQSNCRTFIFELWLHFSVTTFALPACVIVPLPFQHISWQFESNFLTALVRPHTIHAKIRSPQPDCLSQSVYWCDDPYCTGPSIYNTSTATTRAPTTCEAHVELVATGNNTLITPRRGLGSKLPASCGGDFRNITCQGGTCLDPTNYTYGLNATQLDPPAFLLAKDGEPVNLGVRELFPFLMARLGCLWMNGSAPCTLAQRCVSNGNILRVCCNI